jgi:hypothetical protein
MGNSGVSASFGGRLAEMKRSEMFRQYAEQCLRVAEAMPSGKNRTVLVTMANAFHKLAQDHERRTVAEPKPTANKVLMETRRAEG